MTEKKEKKTGGALRSLDQLNAHQGEKSESIDQIHTFYVSISNAPLAQHLDQSKKKFKSSSEQSRC